MFYYANDYKEAKSQLNKKLTSLKKEGFHIFTKQFNVFEDLKIDKITIVPKKEIKNKLILSTGLHGIEGFVGHSCIIAFLDQFLSKLLDDTEVIIYHVLNPNGMKNYRRTNQNNVDLNRNFSIDGFKDINDNYDLIKNFFTPYTLKNIISSNSKYYTGLAKLIKKHGIKTLNDAIIKGQNSDQFGLYYAGLEYETSTKYLISEMEELFHSKNDKIVWIDIHTGYGPRYQMSIINSRYETEVTSEMINSINYPLILGAKVDDIYDTNGDIIEKLYHVHSKSKTKTSLYATCFEFGTTGTKLLNKIESLKAMYIENSARYAPTSQKNHDYSKRLMMKQFMPQEILWRQKAYDDFIQATNEILKFNKVI